MNPKDTSNHTHSMDIYDSNSDISKINTNYSVTISGSAIASDVVRSITAANVPSFNWSNATYSSYNGFTSTSSGVELNNNAGLYIDIDGEKVNVNNFLSNLKEEISGLTEYLKFKNVIIDQDDYKDFLESRKLMKDITKQDKK